MADMSKVKLPDNNIYNLRDDRFIYEKSVSASDVATFSDGADNVPLKSLTLDINPTQEGSGDPYPAGGGINKWDEEWETGTFNTTTGAKITNANQIRTKNLIPVIPSSSYYFKCPSGIWTLFYDSTQTLITSGLPSGNAGTSNNARCFTEYVVTIPSDCYYIKFYCQASYGNAYNHDISINYPSTNTSYHPYSNICPITGVSSVNVTRCGKNLFDKTTVTLNTRVTTSGTTAYPSVACSDFIKVPTGDIYISNVCGISLMAGIYIYNKDKEYVRYESGGTTSLSKKTTIASGECFIRLNINHADIDICQVELGSTATDYEPYTGNTYLIQLGDTYYGGELDVTNGVLRVTKKYKQIPPQNLRISVSIISYVSDEMKSGNALAGMCDTFKTVNSSNDYGVRFGANNTIIYFYKLMDNIPEITNLDTAKQWFTEHPVNVCYELATPIEIDLTPTQINSLLGSNNIWHDANGTTACTYIVDTPLVNAIKDISPEVIIDDSKTVTDQTWSSNKIASEISTAINNIDTVLGFWIDDNGCLCQG